MSNSPYIILDQPFVDVNFALPADMNDCIRKLAADNGISYSEAVLRLLLEGFMAVDAEMQRRARTDGTVQL